jgi:hypothetical protein
MEEEEKLYGGKLDLEVLPNFQKNIHFLVLTTK